MRLLRIIFSLAVLLCLTAKAHAATFRVEGAKILKDGQEFVIKGVNVNGPGWVWGRGTIQDADLIVKAWKFNTVRINCYITPKEGQKPTENEDLAALVKVFTDRDCVVQLEAHDFTGKQATTETKPNLQQLKAWWAERAREYKNNPYVWFNIANEPGKQGNVPVEWLTMHEECIAAIRAEGANNIIVCDGTDWATENANSKSPTITTSQSAILTYGPQLTQKYANVCFAIHIYHQWNRGGVAKMGDFLDRAAQANLSVHIGEWGQSAFAPWESVTGTTHMFSAIRPRKVGRIAWHWYPGDNNKLTTATNSFTPGGGWMIEPRDGTRPTNLSWMGELAWDDNHDLPLIIDNKPEPLSRAGWTATASSSFKENTPDKVLDGGWDAPSAWISGRGLDDGQWIQIDMTQPQTFNRVDISSQYDTFGPKGYKIYAFDDPMQMGEAVVTVLNGQSEKRATFPSQTKRYLRIETVGGFKWGGWWSVREINVYKAP